MAKINNFIKIKTTHDLISYLEDPKRDKEYFYHYTTIDRLNQILKNRYFVFSNFEHMNDGNESDSVHPGFSKNAFVGSFSRADNEVMAMWGMYAIPWEMGVRIGIHKTLFRKWIKEIKTVFAFEQGMVKEEYPIDKASKTINAVCYYDKRNRKLDWSNRRLYLSRLNSLQDPDIKPALNGYIKHKTWSTEEEIRVVIKLKSDKVIHRIAIPIPDEVIKDLKLVLGPCFERMDLLDEGCAYTKSEFTGKVKPKVVCDTCGHRFIYSPDGKKLSEEK